MPKRVAPAATGYVEDLYALEGFPPELRQEIERGFLLSVDGSANDAMTLLERPGSATDLGPEQKAAWSRFIVSLLTRCPEDIDTLRNMWAGIVGQAGADPANAAGYAAIRAAGDPATYSDYLGSAEGALTREEMFSQLFKAVVESPGLGRELISLQWRVLEFPTDAHELLTSDRPVRQEHQGAVTYLALPIGPRKLFVAGTPEALRILDGTSRRQLAKEMNRWVVASAHRFAYGSTDAQLAFVQQHFGIAPQLRPVALTARRFGFAAASPGSPGALAHATIKESE